MLVEELIEIITDIASDDIDELSESSPLIGGKSSIDSMNLVQICLALEDKSNEDGFGFDWQSEKAMSVMNSIFKNPQTLADEYNRQMKLSNQS